MGLLIPFWQTIRNIEVDSMDGGTQAEGAGTHQLMIILGPTRDTVTRETKPNVCDICGSVECSWKMD